MLARFMGPENFGSWSFFYSILSTILLLSYFGINASSKKFVAQYNYTDNLGSVFKSSLKVRTLFSLIFITLFIILHDTLANIIGRVEFSRFFLLASPFIFLAGFVEYYKHLFEGLHRLKYAFFIGLSEHGLKLFLSALFLYIIADITGIIYAFNVAYIFTALLGTYLLFARFYRNGWSSDEDFSTRIIRYSLPLFFVSIGFSILVELDTIMIGLLSSDSEVGIYAVAKQIIIKLPHIALAISLGTMPVFAKLNRENANELKSLFYRLLKTNTIIFGFISIVIISTSWFFIPLLFGQEYAASVIPLIILVSYMFLFSYSIFLSTFLDYQGMAKKRAVNISITITLNIILNLLLIPRYGATGASIGTSLSYMPYVLMNWLEVRKVWNGF